MKFCYIAILSRACAVAPCAGAGIEILHTNLREGAIIVAPCAGAGIEIAQLHFLPLIAGVAPCAGAGIEISMTGSCAKR